MADSRPGRLYAISDVHTDFEDNLVWLRGLSRTAYTHDALIVAGDVSDDTAVLEATLQECTERFSSVLFVPGNHDVWVKRKASTASANSFTKLRELQALCARLGVHTRPTVLFGGQAEATPVLVVPLLSWYNAAFDTEPPVPLLDVPSARKVMTDFAACSWPSGVDDSTDDVARIWDSANDEDWASVGFDAEDAASRRLAPHVVAVSHFLPSIELIPEKRFLFFPNLTQAVGSTFLKSRVASLRPDVHVFGHTHFAYDIVLDDGVRYIQAALAYPHERQSRMSTLQIGEIHAQPVLIYDSAGAGSWAPPYRCRWSDYYSAHPRQPHSAEIPSWVSKRYRRKEQTQTIV
jgi:Calcineurin-like phosphoesterase